MRGAPVPVLAAISALSLMLLAASVHCAHLNPVRVLAPVPGVTVTHMPTDLMADFHRDADLATFAASLNGSDIAEAFVFEVVGERLVAAAPLFWDPAVLVDGTNIFAVSVEIWDQGFVAQVVFESQGDPHADAIVSFVPGPGSGFGAGDLPGIVLGPPYGAGAFTGGLDVLTLGRGGIIELAFVDNTIVDGPGSDFTVFENAFLEIVLGRSAPPFAEPGRVSVSADGVEWHEFERCRNDPLEPPEFPGCAGVYPVLSNAGRALSPPPTLPSLTPLAHLIGVKLGEFTLPEGSGGDSFDLAEVGLEFARYVRIEDVSLDGGGETAGFDLDAVTAIHSLPVARTAL